MNTQKFNQYISSWIPELSDPRLWVEQLFETIRIVLRILTIFGYAAPLMCFWLVVGIVLTNPEPIGENAISMLLEAAKSPSFWSLTFGLAGVYTIYVVAMRASLNGGPHTTFGEARSMRLQSQSQLPKAQ